jgi:hypothetical protein
MLGFAVGVRTTCSRPAKPALVLGAPASAGQDDYPRIA